MTGEDRSTTRAQPHTVDADVEDLSALLERPGFTSPVVLVAHSYSGFVVELFTRTRPSAVAGLVMVDAGSEQLAATTSAARFAGFDGAADPARPRHRRGSRCLTRWRGSMAAPPAPRVPAVVLSADKPYRTDLLPPGNDLDGLLAFPKWLAAQPRLATAGALGTCPIPTAGTTSTCTLRRWSPMSSAPSWSRFVPLHPTR